MSSAPAEMPESATITRYKMAMHDACYSTELGGRLPAGAVVLVDEPTAIRWFELGIADPAAPDAPTHFEQIRNQKREQFRRLAKPAEGVFDAMVGRGADTSGQNTDPYPLARPMPVGRRRGRAALEGAEIVSDPSDEE